MTKDDNKLTLKVLNKKIEELSEKITELFLSFSQKDEEAKSFSLVHDGVFDDIKTSFSFQDTEYFFAWEEVFDNFNSFIKLPPIHVGFNETAISISMSSFKDSHLLEPQLISRYKNSLIEGEVVSAENNIPNFNQMSYIRFGEFLKWAGGEHLNWKTLLYLQIAYLFVYKSKKTEEEYYNWNLKRYCGFQDTGQGIGEFLGIEQLWSGWTFFSFEGSEHPLFDLFKQMGLEEANNYQNKFGMYKNFFYSRWYDSVGGAWNDGFAARLCKNPLQGVEGEKFPF